MNKKEKDLKNITELLSTDFIRAITSNGESGKILTTNLLNRLSTKSSISNGDLDQFIYEYDNGITLISCSGIYNLNVPVNGGLCVHFQRHARNVVDSSQFILQLYISAKIYIRNGRGDGERINYTPWREI
ncbi:MAG: hypothetical protein LIP08_10765 [Bacteroides sp.]|nr:hypothetical protein [Bacteroides sp.]